MFSYGSGVGKKNYTVAIYRNYLICHSTMATVGADMLFLAIYNDIYARRNGHTNILQIK
jgi:hypothetical protein